MKFAPFLLLVLWSYQSVAGTIVCVNVPPKGNEPDILIEEPVLEVEAAPVIMREPAISQDEEEQVPDGLRMDDFDSGEVESTGSEEDFEDIDLNALMLGNEELLVQPPEGLVEGHERLRLALLFYFFGVNRTQNHFDAYKKVAEFIANLKPWRARRILEIVVEHGWSDLVLEWLLIFKQRSFEFPRALTLMERALQNRQFQVGLQLLRDIDLRNAFIKSRQWLVADDFPEMLFDEYDLLTIRELLVELVEHKLMDVAEAAKVGHRVSRQRIYRLAPPQETVVVAEPQPTIKASADPVPTLEKRAHSWGSSAVGNIGTLLKSAGRKTRSLFDKGYKERMKRGPPEPPRRRSLKDDDDALDGVN